MTARHLFFALSQPHRVPEATWRKFYKTEHIQDLVNHGVVRKGAFYRRILNPLRQAFPDDKKFLAVYETDFARCLHSKEFADGVKTTSSLFPNNGGPLDVADIDVRNYQITETFDPKSGAIFLAALKLKILPVVCSWGSIPGLLSSMPTTDIPLSSPGQHSSMMHGTHLYGCQSI